MKRVWLPCTTLRVASFLAPSDQRAEWLEEWRSELWYIPRHGATLFCLGAFRDALWLRRNHVSREKRAQIQLESPLTCLALLVALAAASIFISIHLPFPPLPPPPTKGFDLQSACTAMLLISGLLSLATLAVWRAPTECHPMPWHSRLRRVIFLVLKIALLHPMLFCGLMAQTLIGPLGAFVGFGVQGAFILALRWAIRDQQRRCPICLRLLTEPVRIGAPSWTFLEWYGTESTCSRGHGLLHASEMSSGYSRKPQWLCLGDSWSGLFAKGAGRHS